MTQMNAELNEVVPVYKIDFFWQRFTGSHWGSEVKFKQGGSSKVWGLDSKSFSLRPRPGAYQQRFAAEYLGVHHLHMLPASETHPTWVWIQMFTWMCHMCGLPL